MVVLSIHTSPLIFWAHFQVHFCASAIEISVITKVLSLFFDEVMLLWPQNRPRSHNSNPANKCRCREFVMLHCIKTDQSACSAQTGLAMNSNRSLFFLSNIKEIFYDIVWWRRPINKIEIRMINTTPNKLLFIIFGFVEANNPRNIEMFENL